MNKALLQGGLAASSAAQSLIGNGPAVQHSGSSPKDRKLMKECQQFEAILIANMWREMEKGMDLTDSSNDAGSSTMQGFGIQAAALGIANAGGLGIARMLYQELAPRLQNAQPSSPAGGEAKSE